MNTEVTYTDGSKELFKNCDSFNFWDKCNRVLEVKYILEVI